MSFWETVLVCLVCLFIWGMLGFQLYATIVDWRYRLSERALEAADEGNTAEVLSLLCRMRTRAARNPANSAPESIASQLVFKACEWGHPETAQAVLDELGLTRGELMWEEEGKPPVPFLEYARREADMFPRTIAFLTHGTKES